MCFSKAEFAQRKPESEDGNMEESSTNRTMQKLLRAHMSRIESLSCREQDAKAAHTASSSSVGIAHLQEPEQPGGRKAPVASLVLWARLHGYMLDTHSLGGQVLHPTWKT